MATSFSFKLKSEMVSSFIIIIPIFHYMNKCNYVNDITQLIGFCICLTQ